MIIRYKNYMKVQHEIPTEYQLLVQSTVQYFKEGIFARYPGKYWVAGGAVCRRLQDLGLLLEQDIDLYFSDSQEFSRIYEQLLTDGFVVYFENDNAVKMRRENEIIDLVKILDRTVEEVLEKFDFTVCAAAVGSDGLFYSHEDTLRDVSNRALRLGNVINPFSTMKRVSKYYVRGFRMDNENFLTLCEHIKNVDVWQIRKQLHDDQHKNGKLLEIWYKLF